LEDDRMSIEEKMSKLVKEVQDLKPKMKEEYFPKAEGIIKNIPIECSLHELAIQNQVSSPYSVMFTQFRK
jgi:hypothetical protein